MGMEHRGTLGWVAVAMATVWLAGCKDPAGTAAVQASTPTPATAPPPATAAAPAATTTAAPAAAAVVAAPPGAAPAAPRTLPLGVQGVAPAGVTVRVKSVQIGGDATVLDVSISFANRI
ncbi:MAG: hypothetical protein KUL84_06680, partial [Diaphorobacter sp.]|nr:hypothetical protein [Diaphorobacter sp.]